MALLVPKVYVCAIWISVTETRGGSSLTGCQNIRIIIYTVDHCITHDKRVSVTTLVLGYRDLFFFFFLFKFFMLITYHDLLHELLLKSFRQYSMCKYSSILILIACLLMQLVIPRFYQSTPQSKCGRINYL